MQASISVSPDASVQYLLRIADTCLILSQRLSEWCGHAPVLEEEVALANIALLCAVLAPAAALAQASPFMTGATALQSNILAWLTPIAVILVMVLGGMAMANRISWGWTLAAILGIAIAFGAPQIVTWVRGLFGV